MDLDMMTGNLAEKMMERGVTVSTAESCTGGALSACFVAVPGASAFFLGGVVAYTNIVKRGVLGVSEGVLDRFGAVSRQTAEEMASGALRLFKTDYSVSVTGLAGPGNGGEEKPVGTVWLSVANASGPPLTKMLSAPDGMHRKEIIDWTVQEAVDMLLQIMNNE